MCEVRGKGECKKSWIGASSMATCLMPDEKSLKIVIP
jgi:hypothetical protein